jgi:hypothetical protein
MRRKLMHNPDWELVKNFYEERLHVPKEIVESTAVYDILELAAKGFSNSYISESLQMDKRYIRDALIDFLHFTGWKMDLDISPIDVYNRCSGNFTCFANEYELVSSMYNKDEVLISYTVCKAFTNIKKGLDDYYAGN